MRVTPVECSVRKERTMRDYEYRQGMIEEVRDDSGQRTQEHSFQLPFWGTLALVGLLLIMVALMGHM